MGFLSDYVDIMNPMKWFESGGKDPSVQQVETLSPQQNQLLQALNQQQMGLLNAPGPVPGFPLVPGAGALTQQMQGLAGPMMEQGAQAYGQGIGGPMLGPMTAETIQAGAQPYYDALMNQFTTGTGPGTAEWTANRFGAMDSARSSGMGQAIGRGAAGFGPQSMQMFMQANALNRQQQLQQQQQMTQGGLAGMGMGGDIGQMQDRLAQMQRAGQFQKWQMGLPGQDPRMQNLSLSLGIPAFGNIGMPGYQTPSLFSQAAPAIGGALAFMSDVRLKQNIKPIGNALDKVARLVGSSFNYSFNSPDNRNGGVMAQDLEAVMPDAVSEINGVKFVRYDAVVGLLINAVNELSQKIRRE